MENRQNSININWYIGQYVKPISNLDKIGVCVK